MSLRPGEDLRRVGERFTGGLALINLIIGARHLAELKTGNVVLSLILSYGLRNAFAEALITKTSSRAGIQSTNSPRKIFFLLPQEYKRFIDECSPHILLDVREPVELEICSLPVESLSIQRYIF